MFDPVYIIRDASFGMDFTPKFWAALIAIGLVIWDWRSQKRLDYLWVFLTGTLLWAAAEIFLSVQGIRQMPTRALFGEPIPLGLSYVIQGMSEGALVAIIGLFVGDRFLCRARRTRSYLIFLGMSLVLVLSTIRTGRNLQGVGSAASRRNILDPQALAVLLVVLVLSILFYVFYRAWRRRTAAMFGVMVAFGALWTLTQLMVSGRWVEVSTSGGFERAGPLVTFGALAFDVVVEIAVAYVPFLAIPVVLRLMRDPRPLPTCHQRGTGQVTTADAARSD